jgi:hypothetical protein
MYEVKRGKVKAHRWRVRENGSSRLPFLVATGFVRIKNPAIKINA